MTLMPDTIPGGVNLVRNPSFEYGTATLSFGSNGTLTGSATRDTTLAWTGTYAVHFQFLTASSGANQYMVFGGTTATDAPVTAGEPVDIAVRWYTDSPNLAVRFDGIGWYDASGTHLSDSPQTAYVWNRAGTWNTEHMVGLVPPAGAVSGRLYVACQTNAAITSPVNAWIDGIHIAPTTQGVDVYLDGDMPDCIWTGTPGASTSMRLETAALGQTGDGGEITYRSRIYAADILNNFGDDISDAITTGSVDIDIDRAVQGTCKLVTTDASVVRAYSWVAVFIESQEEDGTLDSRQVGLFRLDQPKNTGNEASSIVEVSGLDIMDLVTTYRFTDTYNVPLNLNVKTALINLLALVGITRTNIPATTRLTGKVRSFKPGDPLTDALISLTKAMGWYAIYADPTGQATTRPYRELNVTQPTRTYTLGQRSTLVGDIVTERNDDSFANVVIMVKDDPTTPLKSVARNDDPRSPLSTTYPGGPGTVAITLPVTDITTQAVLDSTARQELASRGINVAATLQTLPDPSLDAHDVVRIVADPALYPHLEQANGDWYLNQISYGLAASAATATVRIRRSESHG